jgi:hypothetical protein
MLDEAAGWDDLIIGLRPVTRGTKGKVCQLSCLRWCSETGKGIERKVASLPSPQQPSRRKELEKKKRVTSRGSFKFSELSSKTGTKEFDLLGFLPKDQASTSQQGPHRGVRSFGFPPKVPSTPHLLQAANLQPMLVGTVETLVTIRIIVLS